MKQSPEIGIGIGEMSTLTKEISILVAYCVSVSVWNGAVSNKSKYPCISVSVEL